MVAYLLFQRYEDDWYELIEAAARDERPPARGSAGTGASRATSRISSRTVPDAARDAAHLFALGFQARRAFHHIFRQIFGGSLPAARLRAAVWQSIFTARHAGAIASSSTPAWAISPTLITRRIGYRQGAGGARHRPVALRAVRCAHADLCRRSGRRLLAVNLAALSPTLIESELFGHRRGAFTGAVDDRRGWFETCSPHGAVFLDEIGELDADIQVKLLRVLQSREFQRVGETTTRLFAGKLIAATHRELGAGDRARGAFARISTIASAAT